MFRIGLYNNLSNIKIRNVLYTNHKILIMKYLKDFDYDNVDNGLDYLSKKVDIENKNKLETKIIYHNYWYGNLDRKQLLCINSYLKTQKLANTELWIWLDYEIDNRENIKLIPNHDNIKIKIYNPNIESKNTPFQNKKFLTFNLYIKFRSDIARLLFLYNYGGLYFDLDMILLKDLDYLLNIEFCYTWSNIKNRGNNGILRLFKNSKNCIAIMNQYYENIPKRIGTNKEIFIKDCNYDIYCLPCVLFDPVWILHDTNINSNYSKLNNFDDFLKQQMKK